jgi:hypothetical protein
MLGFCPSTEREPASQEVIPQETQEETTDSQQGAFFESFFTPDITVH